MEVTGRSNTTVPSIKNSLSEPGWEPSTQVDPWYFMYANYYLAGEYISPFVTAGAIYIPSNTKVDLTLWPGAGIEFRTHVGPTLRITFYLPKASPIGTVPGWPEIWSGLTLGYCF